MAWTRFLRADCAIVAIPLSLVALVYAARGSAIFSPGPLHTRTATSVRLGGVRSHAELANDCARCHPSPLGDETMGSLCLSCHQEIERQIAGGQSFHGKFSDVQECRTCHTEHKGPSAVLTSFAHFDHGLTKFPLTGAHRAVDCAKCHVDQVYLGTSQSCVSCHAEPKVHLGKFGTNCGSCHETSDWKRTRLDSLVKAGSGGGPILPASLASFDHSRTAFPLTGAHLKTNCGDCHKNGLFKGTAQTCVSCHAEPKVHLGKFGTNCSQCHSTTDWKNTSLADLVKGGKGAAGTPALLANFDHSRTAFPLTGAHQKTGCALCHVNGQFKGTSQSCLSCHAEPVVHKGRFGTNCAKCHSTTDWKNATLKDFAHTFPLTHGGGKKKAHACALCHPNANATGGAMANDYTTYTCYGCHKHDPAKTARKHQKLSAAELAKCVDCHPTGREDERRRKTAGADSLETLETLHASLAMRPRSERAGAFGRPDAAAVESVVSYLKERDERGRSP